MSTPTVRYYVKEVLSTQVWLSYGKQAPWEPIGDDTGILSTSDAQMIHDLENLRARGVGGIVLIDEAQYNAKKKQPPTAPPSTERSSLGGIRAAPTIQQVAPKSSTPPPGPPVAVPVAAAEKPELKPPVGPPRKPRTGRVKSELP